MASFHYLVFIGAAQPLADALRPLEERLEGVRLLAPAARNSEKGICPQSISKAMSALVQRLRSDAQPREIARLSVWSYEPETSAEFDLAWRAFGKAGWVEFVPRSLVNKVGATRSFIETRMRSVTPLMHEVSYQVFQKRRSSPFPVPLLNFRSGVLNPFRNHWYRDLDASKIKNFVNVISNRFRQGHGRADLKAHEDDRGLIFEPAGVTVCHGQPHPTGDEDRCYVEGRFRFGSALFPGFHYEVTSTTGHLAVTLYDCRGAGRDMSPERRSHINVFPNEHLLPERS